MQEPDPFVDAEITRNIWAVLNHAATSSKKAVCEAAIAWLEQNGAGCPEVPLFQEKVRSDALYWAELAEPTEIEAYVVAGIDRVKTTNFGSRQMKRLAGSCWRRMSPKERAEFQEWITGTGKDAK